MSDLFSVDRAIEDAIKELCRELKAERGYSDDATKIAQNIAVLRASLRLLRLHARRRQRLPRGGLSEGPRDRAALTRAVAAGRNTVSGWGDADALGCAADFAAPLAATATRLEGRGRTRRRPDRRALPIA